MSDEKSTKSISELLNEVDYDSLKNYEPSQATLEFINFIQLCEDGKVENKTPIVHLVVLDKIFGPSKAIAIMCHRGFSKCLDINTRIVTPDGYKLMKDIAVGDTILDMNLDKTLVTSVSDVYENKKCYKVTLRDGSSFTCSHDHKHIVYRRVTQRIKGTSKKVNVWREFVKTTNELLAEGIFHNRSVCWRNPHGREAKWYFPIIAKPIEYREIPHTIDPYTFGCFLGDGNFESCRLIGHKDDIFEIASYIPYKIDNTYAYKDRPNVLNLTYNRFRTEFKSYIKNYNRFVREHKFIPDEYLYSSINDRVSMLQGLMDTDGTISKDGTLSFSNVSIKLCQGFMALVRSLGGVARLKDSMVQGKVYYNVYILLPEGIMPFRLKRKLDRYLAKPKYASSKLSIQAIEEVDPIATKCISVDSPTESYVFNDGYITHNSTLCGEYLLLFIAAFGRLPGEFGKVPFAIYVADSIDNGVKSLRKNMEYRYQNSSFLQKMIPNKSIKYGTDDGDESDVVAGRKFTDVRMEFVNARGDHFVVRLYGAKSGVRGTKELGTRPVLAIIDDIISDDDARSDTVISSIEEVIHKAVKYALHPKRQKVIWLGTPFNASDPLYKAVESGAYEVAVYPVCEKFPCTKEEFRGSWEDRFDYEYVKDKYDEAMALGKPDSFYQELMLQIMSDESRLVKDGDIIWYDKKDVLTNRVCYNFYITTDFATSEKTSADYSVISVWAINNNGDYLLVDGLCKKQLMDKNIDALFKYVAMYKPLGVGIEITGQQKGFVSWITREQVKRNVFFNLLSSNNDGQPGIRPVADKFSRFNLFLPRIKLGKLWFCNDMKGTAWMNEALDELSKASTSGFKSRHDDVLDTISMLASFEAWTPSYSKEQNRLVYEANLPWNDEEEVWGGSNIIF